MKFKAVPNSCINILLLTLTQLVHKRRGKEQADAVACQDSLLLGQFSILDVEEEQMQCLNESPDEPVPEGQKLLLQALQLEEDDHL